MDTKKAGVEEERIERMIAQGEERVHQQRLADLEGE